MLMVPGKILFIEEMGKVANKKNIDSPYYGPYKIIDLKGVPSVIYVNGSYTEHHNIILKKQNEKQMNLLKNNLYFFVPKVKYLSVCFYFPSKEI